MTTTESTLPDLEPNAPRVVPYADHLLHRLRELYNRADLTTSALVRDECHREVAHLAISLDRHLTLGGSPPADWTRA